MGAVPGTAVDGAPGGAPAGFVDRTLSTARHGPVAVTLRLSAMAALAVGVAAVHRVNDPGVLCPLRATTGIPCPLCGGTTVFIEMGSGHPLRSLLANPVAFAGALGLAVAPLGLGRAWWALRPKTRNWVLGIALMGSELWQLARLGLLPV